MASPKKRNKKYNPNKMAEMFQKNRLGHCRLYRWESAATSPKFEVFGPYERLDNIHIMGTAMNQMNTWLIVVTSYFLDPSGNYYEEVLTFPKLGPIKLADEMDLLNEVITQGMTSQTVDNLEDYQDTCTSVYPYSKELEANLENDQWVRIQAVNRAAVVLENRKEKTNVPE